MLLTTRRPTLRELIGTNWPKGGAMPFRTNYFRMERNGGRVFLPELVTRDVGDGRIEIHIESVDQCKELPSFEVFDLKNQLNAGVKLEKVNYKMFTADSVPVNELVLEPAKSPNQEQTNNKQEQTNNKQEQTNNGEN